MLNLFKRDKNHTKIGLVLSGGAARGFAHVGIIRALNEYGIYPDVISGVSAGAIAGVLYCDGYNHEEMLEIIKDRSLFKYVGLTIPRNGLLSVDNLRTVLEDSLRAKTFEELKTPFYCNATNLNKGISEYFNKGELVSKVIASASIPVLFKPVMINGSTYVDGGVVDNFPVKPIKNDVKYIIGAHVNPTGEEKEVKGLVKIAERSFHISVNSRIKEMSDICDLFIQPAELKKFGLLSVSEGRKIYEVGYEETMKTLEKANIKKFKAFHVTQ
ncbi:MAG: patatin-like phospholipase family protein [Bacteroidales bacterium]